VIPMLKVDLKALVDEKLSDEDLKKHRVGGRLVTRREIIRSRKCRIRLSPSSLGMSFDILVFSHQPAGCSLQQSRIL